MDVDMPTSTSLGGLSASSSSSEPLDIKGLDLVALGGKMKSRGTGACWQTRIDACNSDSAQWPTIPIIIDVLVALMKELAETTMKASFIDHGTVLAIVQAFDPSELKECWTGLRDGVEKHDWGTLIKHRKLRRPKVWSASSVSIEHKDAVVRAWGFEYHGDAHKVLLRAIDDLHRIPIISNYAKILPIAQSSGMGKSKTVDKVAMERILFPLCLREELGGDCFAYPPTDRAVRDHFDQAPSSVNEESSKEYFRLFLSSLFASAFHQAEQLLALHSKVPYTFMARVFYDFFADQSQRTSFYDDVVRNAQNGPHVDVWKTFKKLEKRLKRRCSDWPRTFCPILISIDEVHGLYTHRTMEAGSIHTRYSRLKSVLNEGVEYNFAIISLSTTSHISRLAPSKEIAPSMRERDDGRILPAAFTELPFDAYIIANPLAPGQMNLTSVGSLEFTARFGRPLFYASYLSRKGGVDLVRGIMRNIREKLSGRSWPPDAPAGLDVSSIAVLSARLLLDLSPSTTDAKRYEEELVRNHLRMLYSMPKRDSMVTGSSPEPLIAEASAQIMHYSLNNAPYLNLWDLLEKFVDHGLAAQGAIGELIGRALSISAMDRAIDGLPDVCELKYQTPVTVADYYKALLTDEAWEDLRQSIPANCARLSPASASRTFEDAFKHAYFHFSHYAKANDSSPMHDTFAWATWLRGTAVVCQLNQELTDRMMPIYFSRQGPVSSRTISVNLDQDKTGQSVNPSHVAIQSAEDLSIFSHGNKMPYIAAVHCYALTKKQGILVKKPSSRPSRHLEADEAAPRYQIDFRGLSAYGIINDGVRTAIRRMIDHSKNSVFRHHPRNYGVPPLRRMLPVLTEDSAATEWFSGEDISNARRPKKRQRRK